MVSPSRRTQRTREVVRVLSKQGCATAAHLVGVDEESRHGSVHGAALVVPLWWSGGRGASASREHLMAPAWPSSSTATGDPLLLIPGLGAGRSAFDHLVPDLASAHRVITFDPRGIGESEGGGNTTLTAMAARCRGGARGRGCGRVGGVRRLDGRARRAAPGRRPSGSCHRPHPRGDWHRVAMTALTPRPRTRRRCSARARRHPRTRTGSRAPSSTHRNFSARTPTSSRRRFVIARVIRCALASSLPSTARCGNRTIPSMGSPR